MSDYRAPIKEMRFVMDELAGLPEISQLPGFEEATPDMADAILEEAAKFASEVLAPLNQVGDKEGCQMTPQGVTTPTGWKAAYQSFCAAGWNGIVLPTEFGGQGLPDVLGVAVKEMVCSANLSFSLGSSVSNTDETRGGSPTSNIAAGLSMRATMARPSSSGLRKPISRCCVSGAISIASIFSPPSALTSITSAAAASTGCAALRRDFKSVIAPAATTRSPSMRKRTSLFRDFFSSPSPVREGEVIA
ncbi:MAG: acyl-CoA dehydrogenase N-terminal domain-containing protein [Rhodocyclaceae bacterium]|nr:acyl-CoA dehydrogenase N-terminal domain-containing protein [Rhodocyclaceae bacterium]